MVHYRRQDMAPPPPDPTPPARPSGGRLLLNVMELNPSVTSPADVRRTNASVVAAPSAAHAGGRCLPSTDCGADVNVSGLVAGDGPEKLAGKRTAPDTTSAGAAANKRGGKAVRGG